MRRPVSGGILLRSQVIDVFKAPSEQNRSMKSADGRVPTVATRPGKKRNDSPTPRRIDLTPTGLLMEGHYTHPPSPWRWDGYSGLTWVRKCVYGRLAANRGNCQERVFPPSSYPQSPASDRNEPE